MAQPNSDTIAISGARVSLLQGVLRSRYWLNEADCPRTKEDGPAV
ncbi:MAG: hypothetical protein WA708_14030 [Acidobacteriaceae bacterium]